MISFVFFCFNVIYFLLRLYNSVPPPFFKMQIIVVLVKSNIIKYKFKEKKNN